MLPATQPTNICPYGPEYQKDWDLLTPLERSFKFDNYGLYAITPQLYSKPIVIRIAGDHIVDASCSIGGMTIALALSGKRVTAIELDESRLGLAAENARIAGVADRIRFIHGNSLDIVPTLSADGIFFDGQWAGPEETSGNAFALSDFRPDGRQFLNLAFQVTDQVILRTPPHFRFADLEEFPRKYSKEATEVDGRIRGYSVYFEGAKQV